MEKKRIQASSYEMFNDAKRRFSDYFKFTWQNILDFGCGMAILS